MGGTAVIVVREDPVSGSEIAGYLPKIGASHRLEMLSLLLISDPQLMMATATTGFASFAIFVININNPSKLKSVLFSSRGSFAYFGSGSGQEWRKELSTASAWTPPPEFVPFYQFQAF